MRTYKGFWHEYVCGRCEQRVVTASYPRSILRRKHDEVCVARDEDAYRAAEDRTERDMQDHYAEQESRFEAVDSGFYGDAA